MMPIRLYQFESLRPVSDARLLGQNQAQRAENCRLTSGTIQPLQENTVIGAVTAGAKTIFKWRGSWLSWTGDVDVHDGFLNDDQYHRILYTGDGAPKFKAVVDGDQVTYDLGVPRPTATPTVVTANRTESTWYRVWNYFYEEPDGTRVDQGTLSSTDINEIIPDKEYNILVKTKVTASADAKFVVWIEGKYRETGGIIGRVFPSMSVYSGSTDLFVEGAAVTMTQSIISSTVANVKFVYDSSDADRYTLDRSYVFTLVNSLGEESAPSNASDVVTVEPSDVAVISGIDVPADIDNYAPITKVRIYRTATGSNTTAFTYVTELDWEGAALTWTDDVPEALLGETLPTTGWTPPPVGLKGLVAVAGGFYAGFEGNSVWFSVPGYHYAWPEAYETTVKGSIVALAVVENNVVVLTTAEPYVITTSDPAAVNVAELSSPQSCVSKPSAVSWSGAVFYASPDGLCMVSGLRVTLLTEAYFSRSQWQALNPATMMMRVYDNDLYLFTDGGNYILSISLGGQSITLTTHSTDATAARYDADIDALVLADANGNLIQFEGSEARTRAAWRSKTFVSDRPMKYGVVRVVAEDYPVTVIAYAEDEEVLNMAVRDDKARRLPRLRPEKMWSFEVRGTGNIRELTVLESMGELN